MTLADAQQETTLSVLYQQEIDALARMVSVLRRLRIHVEALSVIPSGAGTARAVLVIHSSAYLAERARALIGRLVPVLDVVEIGTTDARGPRAPQMQQTNEEKGLDDGYDPL